MIFLHPCQRGLSKSLVRAHWPNALAATVTRLTLTISAPKSEESGKLPNCDFPHGKARRRALMSRWAGAWAGCEAVGAGGAAVGGALGEGVGAAPGAIVGCIGGGIGGYFFGSKVGGLVYDWAEDTFFTPLPEGEQPEE
jgi:hypothetical protein